MKSIKKQKNKILKPLDQFMLFAAEESAGQDAHEYGAVAAEKNIINVAQENFVQIKETQEQQVCKKQRMTIHISSDIIEKVKNVVYWEPGLTLAGFAQEALAAAVEQLEQERGAVFPDRKTHNLRAGRPIK